MNFFIAYSGGVDSSYLIKVFTKYKSQIENHLNKEINIYILFYNHGTEYSQECQEFNLDRIKSLNYLNFYYFNNEVIDFSQVKGNLENEWRVARYKWFDQIINEISQKNKLNKKDNYLVLGHHMSDNLVNNIQYYMRGGRRYIKPISNTDYSSFMYIIRPLYLITKSEIYEEMNEDEYKEDPTNPLTLRGLCNNFIIEYGERDPRSLHIQWQEYYEYLLKKTHIPSSFPKGKYKNKKHPFWGLNLNERVLHSISYLLNTDPKYLAHNT